MVRLETLLWGGDDILFVVPPGKDGRWFPCSFVTFRGRPAAIDGSSRTATPFTYTAGLVFCNYKASIHRMRDLAEELLVLGKRQASEEGHQNWLGYEVLESYDVASDELPALARVAAVVRWGRPRIAVASTRPTRAGRQPGANSTGRRGESGQRDLSPEDRTSRPHDAPHPAGDQEFDGQIKEDLKLKQFGMPKGLSLRRDSTIWRRSGTISMIQLRLEVKLVAARPDPDASDNGAGAFGIDAMMAPIGCSGPICRIRSCAGNSARPSKNFRTP